MLSLLEEDLARYVEEHAVPEPALLTELRQETQRTLPDPQMQVGPVEGGLLRLLVQISGSRNILEIGTYSGYSALCMAAGLPAEGKIVTCDVDPVATAVARRYFDRSEHADQIEIRLGPALETVRELAAQSSSFDLVFIDADKEAYVDYWEAVIPMIPPGGLVVADNTLWGGRVLSPRSESDHGIVRFNHRVASDDRVDQILLAIRDGVMIARKRSAP
jgi:caffeoyl-CoA O-methyltransferase